jgi:hypothetical protein
MRRARLVHLAPVVFTHSCRPASARGSLSIGIPNAFATQWAVISPWVGPIPPCGEDIGAAMPERIECVDDRSLLLIADHPHFLEIDADCRQIFCHIADILVLGEARQSARLVVLTSAPNFCSTFSLYPSSPHHQISPSACLCVCLLMASAAVEIDERDLIPTPQLGGQ